MGKIFDRDLIRRSRCGESGSNRGHPHYAGNAIVAGTMHARGIRGSAGTSPAMSALGQKQTLHGVGSMSALPPKADIAERDWHVRFVPKADIRP